MRQRSTANEEDRELYYRSLEAFDVEGEWEPLKLFLEAELVKTWDHPVCVKMFSVGNFNP